jgi:amino acid adenylation domain-containing protein
MTAAWVDCAAEVLGGRPDPEQSFIELGGDSLAAMRLAALADQRLGVRVPLVSLLSGTPLAEVFAEVGAEPARRSEPVATDQETAALSHSQRGMWLIESLTGGSPYNLVFLCFVAGTLDAGDFAAAVRATTARHPGLRTVYRDSDGAVVPEVLATHEPRVDVVPATGDEHDFDEFVRATAAEHGRRPFDLAAAPAFRFLRVEHPAGRTAVVLLAHHMVLDGWAVGLLLTEVVTRYDALRTGAPDPYPVTAPGIGTLLGHQEAARASGEWDRQTEFWIKHLDSIPSVLELPADRQRPAVQDSAGARASLDLGTEVSTGIAATAKSLGITPFAFLLGAFALTLSRWTGSRRLLVGVPLTGRTTPALEALVAVAGNLVPVRVDVDDDATVAAFLRSVHHSLATSIDAGDLPFEELVARLGVERSLGCHPLVQACFGMHDQLVPQRIETPSATVTVEEGHGGGSQFDLTLLIGRSRPSLAGHLEYATAVWLPAEADGFLAGFRAAAAALTSATDRPLADVRCCAPEQIAALTALNDTGTDFPAITLDALFRTVVDAMPDAVAVREGDVQLTYAELAGAVARQAELLLAAGVGPGDRVLIAVRRSVAEAVAVLGTVWAGAAYVGIDLTLPAAHTARIVAKAAPAAAISVDGTAVAGVPGVAAWQPEWPAVEPVPADVPDDVHRLAYVAFTSGSTGEPKGVTVPHRAVLRLVHRVDYVRLGPGERVLRMSPLAFDASTLELWGALLTGATLEVHPAGLPTPSELGRFLLERGVTVAWLTAGLFRVVEEFAPRSLAGLRQLLTGGDVVPHDHVARALAANPGLVITNGYGPTENTTFTASHSVTDPADVDGPLPIGVPLRGTRVYVLDERARLVPPGAVGELYAAGEGLADGYLDDPAETDRVFGHFSPDVPERLYRTGDLVRIDTRGRLRFLGRRDDQVKLRGYRVELSAITDALTRHPRVRDAVVVATDGDSAQKRLVAGVVLTPESTVDSAALRDALAERLPGYMVPTLWAVVDRIPVTANGKVDRRALAASALPAGRSTATAPERDDLLDRVSGLFVEALDQAADCVPDTDFFTVGGNSLGAVRLVKLVQERLGVRVRLRDFLRSPTPAGMRQLVEKAAAP